MLCQLIHNIYFLSLNSLCCVDLVRDVCVGVESKHLGDVLGQQLLKKKNVFDKGQRNKVLCIFVG